MAYINKWKFHPQSNTLEINDKYEIDLYTGTIWYSWNYAGNRSAPFPSWLFAVRDGLQIKRQLDCLLYAQKKNSKKIKCCDYCGREVDGTDCCDDGATIMCRACEQSGKFGHY